MKVFQENIRTENNEEKLCLKEKHGFNSHVFLRTHLCKGRMTTWAGPGVLSGFTKGGRAASEEARWGFPHSVVVPQSL